MIAASFSGPLPPPAILEGYERVLPGSADRIISMAESQVTHRQGLESHVVHSDTKNERTGMWLAFALTILLLLCGFVLLLKDKPIAAYFAIFGPTVFHAGNYIYNRYKHERGQNSETD